PATAGRLRRPSAPSSPSGGATPSHGCKTNQILRRPTQQLKAAMEEVLTHRAMAGVPEGLLSARAVLAWPMPDLAPLDRLLVRGLVLARRRSIGRLDGLEHIAPARDPFILALNHSTRTEAVLVPALLLLLRGGRRIHFLADWNFRMIPGVDLLYRRSGAITVARKSARPRVLNVMK